MSENVGLLITLGKILEPDIQENNEENHPLKMPEEKQITDKTLKHALDHLEDKAITKYVTRIEKYEMVKQILQQNLHLPRPVIERILMVCVLDMKEDLQYTAMSLDVISSVLNKLKKEEYTPLPNLIPSALAVINIIKAISLMRKVDILRGLSFDVLLKYPKEVLVNIAENYCTEVLEIFDLYYNQEIPLELKIQTCNIIIKFLKILPPSIKTGFVKEGLSLWFSNIIPLVMMYLHSENHDNPKLLEVLELLAEELVNIDYTYNPQWQCVLENICKSKKYPLFIYNSLLEKGSEYWDRLWMVFIKLLGTQITQNSGVDGTPINAMLPVVELAFKMDTANRCKAFKCWNVLIDNFCTETNELCVAKRIKLLVIPLKLNNAKVEVVALAKFNSWWHLIRKFQPWLDKFVDTIIIPFLHFCFGKHSSSKPGIAPGQISDETKSQCVKALVEIAGHVNCDGCTDLPKLNGKLIRVKYLVDHWNEWMHCLRTAIKVAAKNNTEQTKQQVRCLWKSFIMTIVELPANNIRKDLFSELLKTLTYLLQGCDNDLADIVFNDMILSLYDEEIQNKRLFDKGKESPLYNVLTAVLDTSLYGFYNSTNGVILVEKFKQITDVVVVEPRHVEWLVNTLIKNEKNDINLKLWIAFTESLSEFEGAIWLKIMYNILMWPLKSMDQFNDINSSAMVWHAMYNLVHTKMTKKRIMDIDEEILDLLIVQNEFNSSNLVFALCATLAVLKSQLVNEKIVEEGPEFLQILLSKVDNYQYVEKLFPLLVDTLVVMLNNATTTVKETLARNTMTCIKKVLSLIIPVLKEQSNQKDVPHLLVLMEYLLKPLEELLKIESYSNLNTVVVDELIECALFRQTSTIVNNILSIAKMFSGKEIHNKVTAVRDQSNEEFTTPLSKEVSKKAKKKEPSIVNKVVENGEEYVVVKSNWKFNPKKLTENQKEKFQRKREDIPALYQDLSQSQDEFKLATWKADSQDTSSNSKSSKTPIEESSVNLQTLANTDVVPKIIQNIFSENVYKETLDSEKNILPKDKLATPKNTKSPRMALKDRVFRNVRNLLEKSTSQNQNMAQNQIDSVLNTPSSKAQNTINLINSAPPLNSSERPSRVKRKPKKYDDTELFSLKRRRHSQNDSPVDIDIANNDDMTSKKEEQLNYTIEHISVNPITNHNDNEEKNLVANVSEIVVNPVKPPDENIEKVDTIDEVSVLINNKNNNDNTKEINAINEEIDSKQVKLVEKKDTSSNITVNHSEPSTSKLTPKLKEIDEKKPLVKRSTKKSRIEKELSIDMVEGHPFLKMQSEKRLTRKSIVSHENSVRKKTLTDRLNKSISNTSNTSKNERSKDKSPANIEAVSVPESESQEKTTDSTEDQTIFDDLPCSEDVIESSQDSSLTTISVKSSKRKPKMLPVITLERMKDVEKINETVTETQTLLQNQDCDIIELPNTETGDETELSNNRTAVEEKTEIDLTENMDTLPIEDNNISLSADVIIVNNDNIEAPIVISSDETTVVKETQEMAEANTQPTDSTDFLTSEAAELSEFKTENINTMQSETIELFQDNKTENADIRQGEITALSEVSKIENLDTSIMPSEITELFEVDKSEIIFDAHDTSLENESQERMNMDISIAAVAQADGSKTIEQKDSNTDASSPYKDDIERQQDFLNNTLQISPIKTESPERQNKSSSPETSSDYVVIKLSSPVHSNGEPFEKCASPEFFTEDKISPDKRDQSPPRGDITINNVSPSSSLSLKKNRPQVRPSGRAAHMLGLCVPDKLHTIMNSERSDPEEGKKCSPSSTPARRNLRILYNSVTDTSGNVSENEDSENFLKLKKSLPAVDSSPSGPILKRKLVEIADDMTISPASKRKRVSFHDPPVSTTISVQKYIEPFGIRSPQSSAQKRQERQIRLHANMKSPKRLDTVFKLDTILTKAVESFTDADVTINDDTQTSSLEQTPAVEIVKTCELNDTDPICAELLDCKDPINNIASELSSPAMKDLLIKELEGNIETVGDLAKMTEIEVNRLCIKAPKVKVAKKVLEDYASKMAQIMIIDAEESRIEEQVTKPKLKVISVELEEQTSQISTNNVEVQTVAEPSMLASTQTETSAVSHTTIQTEESGCKSTADVISSCLAERQDFIGQLGEKLEESHVRQIAENLSINAVIDSLMQKCDASTSTLVLNRILEKQKDFLSNTHSDNELSFLRDYICDRFDSRDLILFCSQLLQKVHDKSV